jgi:hypothetical protein
MGGHPHDHCNIGMIRVVDDVRDEVIIEHDNVVRTTRL